MAQRWAQETKMSQALAVENLTPGSWSARWGDWVIRVCGGPFGWRATVWRWTTGGRLHERTQLGDCFGFGSPVDATKWACDILREGGARVMVLDKPSMTLETLLRFNPAPEAVA